ncbi:hypothetical protein DSO57_1032353 [Entomophthora muscae]|uniref:Uncharacterized protein n=1 Tax=Entomophthora muscae TaxID=34485 RepID=A0ACC2TBA5_9FUNG|nr:hypothetical protein DSO57_1032353 [Entomophthora muscae]
MPLAKLHISELTDASSDNLWVKPMKDYNQHSAFQSQINVHNRAILKDQAEAISETSQSEFHLADFGCSHGKNSMECIKAAFDGYTGNPSSIRVYLNDLPTNDFGEVFKCLNDSAVSYNHHSLALQSKISTCVNGKSFSGQCFPDDHLHLAFSFNCLHWMEKHVNLSKAIVTTSHRVTPEEASMLAKDAHAQLVCFLKSRAKELKKGGRLVMSFAKKSPAIDLLDDAWADYVQKKGYKVEDFGPVAIPIYTRTDTQVQGVIDEVKSDFRTLHQDSDNQTPSASGADVMRSTTFNSLLAGLEKSNIFTSTSDCEAFIDGFYASLERHDVSGIPLHTVVLERI